MKATVRVELHYANESDYQELHGFMERLGFSRLITGSDGKVYQLPPAEYVYGGSKSGDEIFALAKQAANATGKRFAVFMTEGTSRTWVGLEVVQARSASTILTGGYLNR